MMRTALVLLAAAIAIPAPAARAQDKTGGKEKIDEVKELDHKLSQAILKGDFDMLDKHTAEHYMMIDPLGNVWGKKKNIEFIKSKKVTFDSIKDTDVKARVYGNTAVVTGLAEVKGKAPEHDINGEYRWTRVYTMMDGRWQCVTEQLTYVTDPSKLKKK